MATEVEIERNEPQLIQRIRAGEKALFHDLVQPYERGVYLAAHAILRNEADAEEVAQESMLKAFAHLDQLREDEKFKNWLFPGSDSGLRMKGRLRGTHRSLPSMTEIFVRVPKGASAISASDRTGEPRIEAGCDQ